ncbi:MAG: hypothetical protein KGL95_05300, partial [Patescibacteria group bacterium]|nr:hypothetical protein [Patescibacteria group bacterium]
MKLYKKQRRNSTSKVYLAFCWQRDINEDMAASHEQVVGGGKPRFLERVASTVPALRSRYSETATYPYASTFGNKLYDVLTFRLPAFLRSPDRFSQFNDQLTLYANIGRDALRGVENPRGQFISEIGTIAGRVNTLVVACDNPEGKRRNQHIDQFQEGFVQILEDVMNGTNADGKPNEFKLLSQAAKTGIQRFPERSRDYVTKDPKGRLIFRTDVELSQVADRRKGKLSGLVNKAIP